MKKERSILAFLAVLFLGLFLVVPAEDLTETAYDESETRPCEQTPLTSDLLPSATASAMQRRESPTDCQSPGLYRATATRTDERDRHRSADERVALALLCTLLC